MVHRAIRVIQPPRSGGVCSTMHYDRKRRTLNALRIPASVGSPVNGGGFRHRESAGRETANPTCQRQAIGHRPPLQFTLR